MIPEYIQAAMKTAVYDILKDGEGFFGNIPGLDGVWANAATLEDCRQELQEVLEEWLVLGIRKGHPIPAINGVEIKVAEEID